MMNEQEIIDEYNKKRKGKINSFLGGFSLFFVGVLLLFVGVVTILFSGVMYFAFLLVNSSELAAIVVIPVLSGLGSIILGVYYLIDAGDY